MIKFKLYSLCQMRTKSAARKEYIVFMNNDTLLYWHKLENFYPYTGRTAQRENKII